MWILAIPEVESAGLVAHERWLRPGSTVTIGRKEDNDIAIRGAKSVSKQHVAILIEGVKAGSSSNVSSRGKIVIKDLGATFKTFLTIGAQTVETTIEGEYELTAESTRLRLGKAVDIVFRIYWRPFVFALSGIKSKDLQKDFDSLDLKYQKDYSDLTTHVVTNKYNTPKCLQALACSRYIVGTAFIHAMLLAADQMAANMQALPSTNDVKLLPNDDFSKEFGHNIFFPKKGRDHAYKSLEFVFFDKTQHKSLDPPISSGHGKSFLFAEPFSKKSISTYLERLTKPVVVLTLDEVQTEVLDQVVSVIDGISVTQGDFIRILLSDGMHDVFKARPTKPWPTSAVDVPSQIPEKIVSSGADQAGVQNIANTEMLQTQPSVSQTVSKRIGSRPVKTLANFEDDLFGFTEPAASQKHTQVKSTIGKVSDRSARSTATPPRTMLDDIFDTGVPISRKDRPSTARFKQDLSQTFPSESRQDTIETSAKRSFEDDVEANASQPSRKRSRSQSRSRIEPFESEFEVAPAAAALTRELLRTHNSTTQRLSEESQTTRPDPQFSTIPETDSHRAEITEESIQATLKASKRRAELASQVEDDGEGRPANDELRNLGTVEFFPLVLKEKVKSVGNSEIRSDRWDPKWNGRKNFKKFRPNSKSASRSPAADAARPSFMIRLVESTPSDRGLRDHQWLESARTRNYDPQASMSRTESSSQVIGGQSGLHLQHKESHSMPSGNHQSQAYTNQSTKSNRYSQSTIARKGHSNSLFMADDSDSDEDPLKFRL